MNDKGEDDDEGKNILHARSQPLSGAQVEEDQKAIQRRFWCSFARTTNFWPNIALEDAIQEEKKGSGEGSV